MTVNTVYILCTEYSVLLYYAAYKQSLPNCSYILDMSVTC